MTAEEAKALTMEHLKPEIVQPFFDKIIDEIREAAKHGHFAIPNIKDVFAKPTGPRPSPEQWNVLYGMLQAKGFSICHSAPTMQPFPLPSTTVSWR